MIICLISGWLAFLLYRSVRIIKTTGRTRAIRTIGLYWMIGLILPLSALMLVRHHLYGDRLDCEASSKEFDGGRYEYQGKTYKAVVCDTGFRTRAFMTMPGDGGPRTAKYALIVYSYPENRLLAERLFTVDCFAGSHFFALHQEGNKLYYGHDNDTGDYEGAIRLPPSPLEWIRARLP